MPRTVEQDIIHERAFREGLRQGYQLGESSGYSELTKRVDLLTESIAGLKRVEANPPTEKE